MVRAIIAALFMAVIASCDVPAGDTPLSGLDLNDSRVVREIAQQLPDHERVAFTTYALLHWPGSKHYCGQSIGPSGQVAKTVGEAVAQTLKSEADLAIALEASHAGPTSEIDRMRERARLLTDRIESLVLKRDVLYARLGASARASEEGRLLEQETQGLQAQRATLEASLVQTATVRM